MNNFLNRLLLTLTSIPLLILFMFWPMKSHIFIIIIFGFVATFFGSYEITDLIRKKNIALNRFASYLFEYFYIFICIFIRQ